MRRTRSSDTARSCTSQGQQRVRSLARLQVFLHLPGVTTRRGSRLGAVAGGARWLRARCAHWQPVTARAATAQRLRACAGANLHPSAQQRRAPSTRRRCASSTRLRVAHGLRPLRANRELRHASPRARSTSMVRGDYFADVRPIRADAAGAGRGHALPGARGELRGRRRTSRGAPAATRRPAHIVAEWMASPPHREIMLSGEYRDAGVAVTPAVPARPRRAAARRHVRDRVRRAALCAGARSAGPSAAARGRLRRRPPTRGRRPRRCPARASTSGRG